MNAERANMLAYNMLWAMAAPAALPLLVAHLLTSRKRRKSFSSRMGWEAMPHRRLGGWRVGERPIWVHALSVGEVLSAVPLVESLRGRLPERPLWVSASTATGLQTARDAMADGIDALLYYPYDLLPSVRRAARAVNPCAAIIVESDLWPNFLFEMNNRQTPVALVNGRLSEGSFRGWRRLGAFGRRMFASLSFVGAQTDRDADRFLSLGAKPDCIRVTGNMKFDRPLEAASPSETAEFRKSMGADGDSRILIAGSTHSGEEAMLFRSLAFIRRQAPDTLLIVAPRDPERAEAVCRICRRAGFAAIRFSDLTRRQGPFDVLVVDMLGALCRMYAAADAAFVGGSLVRQGGHNPLEPAAQGKPVIFGPHTEDFQQACRLLADAGGALRVSDESELKTAALSLISSDARAGEMGRRARLAYRAHRGAVARNLDAVLSMMAASGTCR